MRAPLSGGGRRAADALDHGGATLGEGAAVTEDDYREAVDWIHHLYRFGSIPGLERIERLLAGLGHPERAQRYVHIAGTNGKGSVTAMVAAVLQAAGCCTGMYISPYLEGFRERMMIDGRPISPAELVRQTARVREVVAGLPPDEHPTEFEVVTAIGLAFFADHDVDWAVMEVGLGGRLDATNVIPDPEVSVITNIGIDHVGQLGDTLERIAWEKAGIIREEGTVVSGARDPRAAAIIDEVCRRRRARLIQVGREVWATGRGLLAGTHPGCPRGQRLDAGGPGWEARDVVLPLLGAHQLDNAACALAAVQALADGGRAVTPEAVRRGLQRVRWPGRLEFIPPVNDGPRIVLDIAHNADGARALARALEDVTALPGAAGGGTMDTHPGFAVGSCGDQVVLVLGILADKAVEEMVATLLPLARRVIVTSPQGPRAMAAPELAAIVRRTPGGAALEVEPDIGRALERGLEAAGRGTLLVTGSTYLVGPARGWFRRRGLLVQT